MGGGVATPVDAALMMQLGMDGVFVGSGIFKSSNPEKRARAIVEAVANYNDPKVLAKVSEDRGHGWHQLRGHEGALRQARGRCHGSLGARGQEAPRHVVSIWTCHLATRSFRARVEQDLGACRRM